MDNFIKIYSDLEEASDRILQVLMRQCFQTLLREHQHKAELIEYEFDGAALRLRKPVLFEFRTFIDGDFRIRPMVVNSIRFRYQSDGVMIFEAQDKDMRDMFEIKLTWDGEDLMYGVCCSCWNYRALRNEVLHSLQNADEPLVEETV